MNPSGLLARNVVFNLAGQVAPALAALVALPLLAHGLGTQRFGVLNIAWVVIGYFSLFDLGLGRALTQAVAASIGARDTARIPGLVWTAWVLLLLLGVAGAVAVAVAAPWLTRAVLRVPGSIQADTEAALYLLACAIPLMTLSSAARGVLEAHQRFDLVNLVRVPAGVLMYAGPALVLPFAHSVVASVGVLVAVRAATSCAYVWLCLRTLPGLLRHIGLRLASVGQLVSSGLWMTVANVAASVMVFADRLVVSTLVSIAAVAYYSTPQEVISKLSIIPGAFSGVMFPAFSTEHAAEGRRATSLFGRAASYTFVVLFPPTFALAAFAPELLTLWLGGEFASKSARVAQWVAFGTLVNGMASTPFALLQAVGRARVTGFLQLAELPLFLAALWMMTRAWGIEGAAAAWGLRIAVDSSALYVASRTSLAEARPLYFRLAGLMTFAVLAFLTTGYLSAIRARGFVSLLVLIAFVVAVTRLVDQQDRAFLSDVWRRLTEPRA